MKKPFRWNIEKRNELGSLINDEQVNFDIEFVSALIKSAARLIAFSDNSNLVFVGRSPENYYDFLKGIYFRNKRSELLYLFQFSGQYLGEPKLKEKRINGLKDYMREIGLTPKAILQSELNTAFVDLVYTGSTIRNLISILKKWSLDERQDWNGIKSKLRIVGITYRTKNSPNTWRWQQQPVSVKVLEGIKVKNVSVEWWFWSKLGNNESKVTPSYSPDNWDIEEPIEPNRDDKHLEGLKFAYDLNAFGRSKEAKNKLKIELQDQIEMKLAWFKGWYGDV